MSLRISLQLSNPALQDKGESHSRVAFYIGKIICILLFLFLGIALLCLPWFRFWDDNDLLYSFPQLRPMVSNPYFKGAVIGLGIADILIGIRESVRLFRPRK